VDFRGSRTGIVQAEARKNGHRYNSSYESLVVRDNEVANVVEFRRWLYDYDVEKDTVAFQRSAALP
jgi:salicylate hydroxylase